MLGKFICWITRRHKMVTNIHECARCEYVRTSVRETEKMEEIS
jgi:hypothetical protein